MYCVLCGEEVPDADRCARCGARFAGTDDRKRPPFKLGYVDQPELVELSKRYGLPTMNLREFEITEEAVRLVPRALAEESNLVPVQRTRGTLVIAMSDPSNIFAIDAVKAASDLGVLVAIASAEAIAAAIERAYPPAET